MRLLLFLFIPLLFGCSVIRDSPKFGLASGYYHAKSFDSVSKKVYIENGTEAINIYPTKAGNDNLAIDTSQQAPIRLPQTVNGRTPGQHLFRQSSFDVDLLTIPVKYRFQQNGFPRQLTASFNGGLYFGYRTDVYAVAYKTSPLGYSIQHVTHYGFSFGGFTGIGATSMNPWVTDNQIATEYEGVVWPKGVTAIVAVNNFTAGLALGWDHLLNGDKKFWIYQNKPWVGLVVGLNIN